MAKKEAMTSNMSSTNKSGGDSLHEAGADDEWEFSGSEDGRSNEGITSTSSFFNYQTFMRKESGVNWSKQDTELFYKAVRAMGTDFSMIQLLFPGRTRHQIKLKYNKEGQRNPFQLTDAVNNPAKDYDLWADAVKLSSTKAKEDPSGDASDFMMAEEVVDLTATNNAVAEVARTGEDAAVKANEDSVAVHSPEQSDDSYDDNQDWSWYKSDY